MSVAVRILNAVLPAVYALAAAAYALEFFREDPRARRAARPLLAVGVVLHAAYLGLRTVHSGHPPLATPFEVMTAVALSVALVYLWVEHRSRTYRTGVFVVAFCAALQAVSSAGIAPAGDLPQILRSPLFAVHTGSAVLGYTGFAVSAIYGLLFLALYHELKAGRFGVVYRRLPPLDVLAAMSLRAAVVGCACLAFTIVFGVLWAIREFPGFHRDPKFILSLVVWGVYATGIGLHYLSRSGGRRVIYLFLAGFSLMVLSAAAARWWLESFHGFA